MTLCHTMPKSKIAVTIDRRALDRLDRLVRSGAFANRSQAVEAALLERLDRIERRRLATECAKLDARAEQDMAEEGMASELAEWPEY